jgi:hypothetical protein
MPKWKPNKEKQEAKNIEKQIKIIQIAKNIQLRFILKF